MRSGARKNYGNYFTALGVSRKEFSANELPKVVDQVKGFDSYDRILIGFPIWYSKCPQLILSFISQYDFRGKEVYPFCTSGMSGPEMRYSSLRRPVPAAFCRDFRSTADTSSDNMRKAADMISEADLVLIIGTTGWRI
ncbi:MAG: hypothetical protein LUD07_08260 [Clostridiales bacterium]|nr:hypothetical protein [Clostridiales bacterium]